MGNIKQPGLSKEIFDQKRLKGGDPWKLSRGESLDFMAEWMNVGDEGRMKALDSVSQEMLLIITLTCIRTKSMKMTDFKLNSNSMNQDFCTSWMALGGSTAGPLCTSCHLMEESRWWGLLWTFCATSGTQTMDFKDHAYIKYILIIFAPITPTSAPTPVEHFLPDKFPSYFHVFRVSCLGPLHYLGLAAQTQVGHYLLKHGQHTSGYNAEENDPASPKNH